MTFQLTIFALILLVTGCIAAGVVGALIHTWSLKALAFSLEVRLGVVEGTLQREVKARAGQERWKKPDRDLELLAAAQVVPVRKKNWWENVETRVKS